MLARARESDVKGESIDEERNQEKGACEKEGCSEEKEVATAGSDRSDFNSTAPTRRGRFYLASSDRGRFIAPARGGDRI